MLVLMLAPGYPGEMPYFCRGLAVNGADVIGVSDVPEHELPRLTREHMKSYIRVANFMDENDVVRQVRERMSGQQVARVVCLWEPGVILAAKIREALGIPGMGVAQAQTFRNKDLMKQRVTAAGVRAPSSNCRTFSSVSRSSRKRPTASEPMTKAERSPSRCSALSTSAASWGGYAQ